MGPNHNILFNCRNSDKESSENENEADGNEDSDKDVGYDDDEWNSLQKDIERPEAILEAKSKDSHPVHAPYFPLVGDMVVISSIDYLACEIVMLLGAT